MNCVYFFGYESRNTVDGSEKQIFTCYICKIFGDMTCFPYINWLLFGFFHQHWWTFSEVEALSQSPKTTNRTKKKEIFASKKTRGFTINSFHSLQTTLLNHLAFWRYFPGPQKIVLQKTKPDQVWLEGFTLQKIRVQTCNWRSTNVHPWKLTWHDWLENPLTF